MNISYRLDVEPTTNLDEIDLWGMAPSTSFAEGVEKLAEYEDDGGYNAVEVRILDSDGDWWAYKIDRTPKIVTVELTEDEAAVFAECAGRTPTARSAIDKVNRAIEAAR